MSMTVHTPISDFIDGYIKKSPLRLHMPGHKGSSLETCADITEVCGADSLFEADGIIRQSEDIASRLFGAFTCYSTEGSSLAIRAMLYLVRLYAVSLGKTPRILAGRNAHKTFLTAAALLDIDVAYIEGDSYLSCTVTSETAERALSSGDYTALYITSPDYLGGCSDIASLRGVCDRFGALLLADNAHGAYLKFLKTSRHPIDCGADMCCDSAHKTLPVLTGGAYLHINRKAPEILWENAKRAMALFASTSPSYLILRSLDRVNPYLAHSFRDELADFCKEVRLCRETLTNAGYTLCGDEELKITLCPKNYGYTGDELAGLLRDENIEVEFSDPDFTVMMLTPATGKEGVSRLTHTLLSFEKKAPITDVPPKMRRHTAAMSPRTAIMSPCETVYVKNAAGRVLADPSVGCPPAVPILICGEVIEKEDINTFLYYGIEKVKVVL